jgi:hypothetical protein
MSTGKRPKCKRLYELASSLRHADSNDTAGTLETPEHFSGLVRRDATADSESDFFSGKRVLEGEYKHIDFT